MFPGFLQIHLSLHRFVAPIISSWFWEIFGVFLLIHAPEASTGGKTDTSFVSQLVEHPVAAEEPEKAPRVSNDSHVQARVNDHKGNDTSDAAPPLRVMSATHDLNDTVTHDDPRRLSLRKVRSRNRIEVGAPARH